MRYPILFVALFIGCGSPEPGNQVIRSGAEEFVSVHRLTPDQAKRRYAGRLVQIYLPPGTHSRDGDAIKYRGSPSIRFACREDHEVPAAEDAIIVTGHYLGVDGRGRTGDCIHVTDCSVTRLLQNRP